MNKKIWLSPPHLEGNELEFIQEAFQSNWVTSLGNNINFFEKSLSSYLSLGKEVALLNSCTSAIHLSLRLLDVGYGDEVLTQSFTFVGSAYPILYQGAQPVFIDSEMDTWNMCPESLENAIKDRLSKGKKIKAIMPVHLYGMPYKIDEINSIASNYDIPIIEDAAESLGSTYKGKKCGTFGTFGTISFNGNKIITTSGGGALVCNHVTDKNKAIFLASQARDNAVHYQHSQLGYNYRMSNILAGIGRSQMAHLEDRIHKRRENYYFYLNIFKDIDGVEVFSEFSEDYFSNHWLSAITVDEKITGKSREDLRLAFLEDNIESRPLWKPMHLQPIFADAPYYGTNVAEKLFDHGLCLPSGSNLSDEDRERITKVIRKFFSS